MARRDPSAASRSSKQSSSRTRAAGPRPRSDGRLDIYCPQCGAHYLLAEAALESKVTCTECQRTFFPKATAGKRVRPPDYSKVYVGFGVGALIVIGGLIAISRGGDGSPQAVATAPVSSANSQLEIDRQSRRDQAMRWARAVAASDLFTMRSLSDMASVQKLLGVDAGLTGDALDKAILGALLTNDVTRLFTEMECASADVSAEATKAGSGPLTLYFNARQGIDYYDAKAGATVTLQWRLEGPQFKVTGFELTLKPIQRKARPGDNRNTFKPSEEIARPKAVEIDLNGRKKKVNESEPVAIAHLADTPADLRDKIDKLVADLLASADPDSPGHMFARTTNALEQIGKPAMPRLINALHDLYPDVTANNQKISQVTRALQQLTGMSWAYDVAGSGDAQKDKTARESVIRQWFAWWWRYANDNYQEGIDQSEDLDAPKPVDAKSDGKKK